MAIRLEWDAGKAFLNLRKHGFSFEEVRSLFASGVEYLEIYDAEHSGSEDRFICIGPVARGIVVVVVADGADDVLRIISARRATHREQVLYASFLQERLS